MYTALIGLQLTLITYFTFTTSLDLHPFNAIRHYTRSERRTELTRNLIPMGIIFGLTLIPNHWTTGAAGVLWILFFIGGGLTWWVPYFTGLLEAGRLVSSNSSRISRISILSISASKAILTD